MIENATAGLIQQKYQDLGLSKGWSFLACPEQRLTDARVAIVGTNPGGGGPNDAFEYGAKWSCDENAFCTEQNYIRQQVCQWHGVIGASPEETLCAQFIPFRSPDLKRLGRQKEAVAFARDLWRWVVDVSPASLFVTMGALPAHHLVDLLGAKPVERELPTGWGNITINSWASTNGRRIVQMPHPSRYKLFGRANDVSALAEESLRIAVGISDGL